MKNDKPGVRKLDFLSQLCLDLALISSVVLNFFEILIFHCLNEENCITSNIILVTTPYEMVHYLIIMEK